MLHNSYWSHFASISEGVKLVQHFFFFFTTFFCNCRFDFSLIFPSCMFQEVMQGFHTDTDNTPDSIYTSFPSIIRLDILPGRMEDLALSKRLLAVCLSSLKTNGSKGVHVELNIGDKYMMEHYRLLGFIQVPNTGSDDTIYFGRLL